MVDVKYTLRGFNLFDVNPEFVSDLERVTDKLYNASVYFPDFNAYEEGITFMHGELKEDEEVHPKSPWIKARFRFDNETRIDSLQGVLFKDQESNVYLAVNENVPAIAQDSQQVRYTSGDMDRLNRQFVQGRRVEQMVIGRGEEYDTLNFTLDDSTEVVAIYKPNTFIGFELCESTGKGIKTTHYALEGVDPSIYVPGFSECLATRKDVVHNEGLMGSDLKPLLQGTKVSYDEPCRESVELVDADVGDQYIVMFKSPTPEDADRVYQSFNKNFEGDTEAGTDIPMDLEQLAGQLGDNVSVNQFPDFKVELNRDPSPDSQFYGLTLTATSNGSFEYRNDLRDLIKGYMGFIESKQPIKTVDIIDMPHTVH